MGLEDADGAARQQRDHEDELRSRCGHAGVGDDSRPVLEPRGDLRSGVVGVVWCGAVWCGACGGAEQFGAEQCGGRGVVGACGGAERVVVRSGVVGAVRWCGVVVRVRCGTVLLYSSAMKYVSSRSRPMASESGRSERDGSTTTIIMPCGERTSDRVDLSLALRPHVDRTSRAQGG